MLALVTGAAGFIGSTLSRKLLDNGVKVRGIDCFIDYYPRSIKEANLAPLKARPGFEFLEQDILKADMAELYDGVEAVFHLAAQAGVRASWGREFALYTDNNMLATQLLLEAAREVGLKRFVYASSSSVYGDTNELPMREEAKVNPVSPYGVSKWAGEQLCRLYYYNFGLPTVSLRYFTVYGPGQRPDMAFHRFLKAIATGEPIRLFGDGSQSRDFTYVEDIVEGTIAALNGRPGATYNLGGGHRIELRDVIRIMEEIIGRKARLNLEPVAEGDVRHTAADISRAEEDFGFAPRTELRYGLTMEIEWLKDIGLI